MVVQFIHTHMQAYTRTYTPLSSKVTNIPCLMARMGCVTFYTSAW